MSKVLRSIAVLSVIGLLMSSITGCSNNDIATTQKGEEAANKPITMRMSWWGGESRNKATIKAIDTYQAKYPNIKIEAEYGGFDGYFEKLTTQLSAGTAPDIMQTDFAWLDQISKQSDLFVDLNTQKNLDLSGCDPDFLKGLTTSKGKLIGAPTGVNATSFFINKNLADKVGVDYSKQLTWDRLLEEGKKLHASNPNMYLLNMTIDLDLKDYIFEPYLLNLTGNKFINDDYTIGFDRDSLIKTYKYINSLYDNGVMQPVAETASIKSGMKFQNPKWLNNELVGILTINSFYLNMKNSLPNNEIVAIEYPSTKGVKNTGILVRATNLYSINSKAKSVDEAGKFVSWIMNDPEAVKILGIERSIPAVASSRKVLMDAGVVDKQFDFSINYAVSNQGLPQNFISTNGEVVKIESDILIKVAYKDWTPEKAADELIKQMTDKLKELKEKNK